MRSIFEIMSYSIRKRCWRTNKVCWEKRVLWSSLYSRLLHGFVIAQHIANFLTTLWLEVCEYLTLTTHHFTHLSFLYSMIRQGRCKRVSGVIINVDGPHRSQLQLNSARSFSTKPNLLYKLMFLQPNSRACLARARKSKY